MATTYRDVLREIAYGNHGYVAIADAVGAGVPTAMPAYVKLTQVPIGTKVTRYRGIRAQPVSEALLECRGRVPGAQLRDAAVKARAEGLLTTTEWNRVRKELAA